MKFKLNSFEKFIIKNHTTMKIIVVVMYILSLYLYIQYFEIGFLAFLITLTALIYVFALPNQKNMQLTKFNNVYMDPIEFINGADLMLEAINPKDLTNVTTFCMHRIVALINIGEFDHAENEIRLFWQSFDLKKIPAGVLAEIHILMAYIALEKNDIETFNEQMNLVYQYREKAQGFAMIKNALDYDIKNVLLCAEAVTADASRNENDFESRVLAHLNTNPINNKPGKKEPQPMSLFTAYSNLFEFFKHTGNTEKAVYYAQQLLNIGNEKLIDYRKAKEYLENANSSN